MSYPNKSVARFGSPFKFDRSTWRISSGGNVFGVTVPKGVTVRWGKLKSGGDLRPQLMLFPLSDWTPDRMREWLKKNNLLSKTDKTESATNA